MGAADRKARYRDIADALGQARSMIEDAMRSPDLADDLIWSWWQGTTEYADAAGRFVDLLYVEREFEKVVKGLAALEAAAARATEETQRGPGRPRGTSVLSPKYVYLLAALYRDRTGSKPGAGLGPFARLVGAYLTAIGQGLVSEATVVDSIKDVRAQALRNPSKWGPAPFED
jgi:hypothetical protein